jgi:hypothetical protein
VSSLNQISKDLLGINWLVGWGGVGWGGGGGITPPPPFLQGRLLDRYFNRYFIKDNVNSFSSTSDMYYVVKRILI